MLAFCKPVHVIYPPKVLGSQRPRCNSAMHLRCHTCVGIHHRTHTPASQTPCVSVYWARDGAVTWCWRAIATVRCGCGSMLGKARAADSSQERDLAGPRLRLVLVLSRDRVEWDSSGLCSSIRWSRLDEGWKKGMHKQRSADMPKCGELDSPLHGADGCQLPAAEGQPHLCDLPAFVVAS